MLAPLEWIIILIIVGIGIVLLCWLFKEKCSPGDTITPRRNAYRSSRPHVSNSNEDTAYLPFSSTYPPEPPQLGFGLPVEMPQPEIPSFNANSRVDMYPPPQIAPYPLHSKSKSAPYPTETNCFPPKHTAPYPLDSSMPQSSTLRSTPYPPVNEAPYPTSSSMPQSSTSRITPYPPANEAPYPTSNSMPQPSSSSITPYPPAIPAPYPVSNLMPQPSTSNITPYPPARQAPYPTSSSMPQPSTNRNQISNSSRITPYPPVQRAPYPPSSECITPPSSLSSSRPPQIGTWPMTIASAPLAPKNSSSDLSEHVPPSYEEATGKKF